MKIIPMNATPPPTYALGRTCQTCGVPLSRYNESDHCSIHQPAPDWRYNGYLVLTCQHCGETGCVSGDRPRRRCGNCGTKR